MRFSIRTLLAGAVALVLLGALALIMMPRAVPVDMAQVTRGEMAVAVEEEGQTRVRDVYTVYAPVAGRVLRIRAEAGDPVVKDVTVVATIRPSDPSILDARSRKQAEAAVKAAQAARKLAEADVKRARAELDYARTELERIRKLNARGTASQATLDRALLEMRVRAAALEEAKAALRVRDYELENARALLIEPGGAGAAGAGPGCCLQLRAPVTGVVLRVIQESEAVVPAGAPLVELGDPTDLEVVTDLLSEDAVRVNEGDAVAIEDWGGAQTLAGVVRRVEPFGFTKVSALGIEEQRVNVLIDFTSPRETWARLGHGYRLDTRIFIWRGGDVLWVPVSALFRQGGDWAVFKVEDGRARLTRLAIGRRNDVQAQVLEGLAEGDAVVIHPGDRVAEGVRLAPRNPAGVSPPR